ncbi:MAG: ribbon-helix-helix protein, CopG family [Coriobacteriia bacterium]|nr:ribbon-helix-helix protein, CopG family [Coriobacteriia bacterium]
MARMVRKQIVIDPEQERALEARAKALGVSQSALVRQAIDSLLQDAEEQERRLQAWERLRAGSERAARDGIGSGGLGWNREELHERGGSR